MLCGPPSTSGRIGKVKQSTFSRPEIECVHRAIVVFDQIALGQRLRIQTALHRQIRFLDYHQAKAQVSEPGNHTWRIWPVSRLEGKVSHLFEPKEVQDQRVTGKAFGAERLGNLFEFHPSAIAISGLQEPKHPAWRQWRKSTQFAKSAQQTGEIRSIDDIIFEPATLGLISKPRWVTVPQIPGCLISIINEQAIPTEAEERRKNRRGRWRVLVPHFAYVSAMV